MKTVTRFLVLLFIVRVSSITVEAQTVGAEFPVAVGGSNFASCGAEGNSNYLIVMLKDNPAGGSKVIAQALSKSDNSLIGEPIELGTTTFLARDLKFLPQVTFNGSQYLVVWSDSISGNAVVMGKFIDGTLLTVSPMNVFSNGQLLTGSGKSIHYNAVTNKYFIVLYNVNTRCLHGLFWGDQGINIFQITNTPARNEYSLAYGDSQYFVCFVEITLGVSDYLVKGRLIAEDGTVLGSSDIEIDNSSAPSDDPVFTTFDGARFIALFPDEEEIGWKVYARFINPNGLVQEARPLISANGHLGPYAYVKGTTLLAAYTNVFDGKLNGRFFDLSCNPQSEEFTIFDVKQDKIPVGNWIFAGSNYYLVFTTRCSLGFTPDSSGYFTNGDVYGVTIPAPSAVDDANQVISQFELSQNYPNPFNPTTKISFTLPTRGFVTLKIYNIEGKEIATLVSEELGSGKYERSWNGEGFPSGVYLCRLQANNFSETKKILLLK